MPDDGGMSGTSLWRGFGKAVLDLFYPPHCALCGCALMPSEQSGVEREREGLCTDCSAAIPRPPDHHCLVCSHPMQGMMTCPNCDKRPWHLEAIVPACRYEGGVREMIQRFKYGRDITLARPLGVLLERALTDPRLLGKSFEMVVPVPLHSVRQRERGFNQASLLAERLSRAMGIPCRTLLHRNRPTPQQAGFDRVRRMENLKGAFTMKGLVSADASVLLVDDVSTTGATLDACAEVLREAGADQVSAVVVARG